LESLAGGVDEAGRGCVLGPLVVAGVSADEPGTEDLKLLGVRDSKKLSSRRRESMYPEILKISSRVCSLRIEPPEIDLYVSQGKKYRKLNYIEAVYFARVIDQLDAERVTVDASDSRPERFREIITENMKARCRVRAVHKADRDFPLVSAASIVAKVERDRAVEKLKRNFGDFGSGYPSDPDTSVFFIERMREGRPVPPFARKSWKTWANFERLMLAPF